MNTKSKTHIPRKRKVRFWPPSLIHLSDWPPRADCFFANCYRSIFEHETLCTVEIVKREIHWLHGVAIAQISNSVISRRLDAGGGGHALLSMLVPVLKHHGILHGPLRIERGSVAIEVPEMAEHFGGRSEALDDGIWLTPEWSPEAEATRASRFEVSRQQADQMRRRIAKERREAALQAERQANQQVEALQMNPLFD